MPLYRADLQGRLEDTLKRPIHVGDTVARATMAGRSAYIEIRKVRRIQDGKIYLDDSHVPISAGPSVSRYCSWTLRVQHKHPCRLMVITSIYELS